MSKEGPQVDRRTFIRGAAGAVVPANFGEGPRIATAPVEAPQTTEVVAAHRIDSLFQNPFNEIRAIADAEGSGLKGAFDASLTTVKGEYANTAVHLVANLQEPTDASPNPGIGEVAVVVSGNRRLYEVELTRHENRFMIHEKLNNADTRKFEEIAIQGEVGTRFGISRVTGVLERDGSEIGEHLSNRHIDGLQRRIKSVLDAIQERNPFPAPTSLK